MAAQPVDRMMVSVKVNGEPHSAEVEARLLLVHFLRETLEMTGTHLGCDKSKALLASNPNPSEAEIRLGISGNLCRCTGYVNIVKAIQYGAAKMRGETPVSTQEATHA